MSIVTPLNESNFSPLDPFQIVLHACEVNSLTFDSASGVFGTTEDTITIGASGTATHDFTIVYSDQNKTKLSSISYEAV